MDVSVTRVTPPDQQPTFIDAVVPPQTPVDPETAQVLRFLGVTPGTSGGVPDPATPETPAPETPAAPETPPAPATPAPAATETPPAAPASPAPETPAKDDDDAFERLNRAADRLSRAAEKLQPKELATPAPEGKEDEEAALRREALRLLEGSKKYAGRSLVGEYDRFLSELRSYKEAWQKENPNATFDYEAEEHEAWRDKHHPDIDDEDVIRAEAKVEARREVQEAFKEQEAKMAAAEADRMGAARAAEAPKELVKEFGVETLEELKAKDPAMALAVREASGKLTPLIRAVYGLEHTTAPADVPGEAWAAARRYVLGTVALYEHQISRLPVEQSVRDGKVFVPSERYEQLTPAQREQAWTLSRAPEVVTALIMGRIREDVKARAEDLRGWLPASAPAAPAPTPAAPAAAPTPSAPGMIPATFPVKPPSPSASGGVSPVVPPASGGVDYFR